MAGIEILVTVLAGVISLLVPISEPLIKRILEEFGLKPSAKTETYSEKLARLTANLTRLSAEVDNVLIEMTNVAEEREKNVRQLEAQLAQLVEDEQLAKKRIEELENTPLSVAEHFAKLAEAGEKRGARRDYLLFGAGVVVSTVIGIILNLIGLGG